MYGVSHLPAIASHIEHAHWTVRVAALDAMTAVAHAAPVQRLLADAEKRLKVIHVGLQAAGKRHDSLEGKYKDRKVRKESSKCATIASDALTHARIHLPCPCFVLFSWCCCCCGRGSGSSCIDGEDKASHAPDWDGNEWCGGRI